MTAFKQLFDSTPENIHKLIFHEIKIQINQQRGANKILKNLLSALKIEPITVHGLRHTQVVNLLCNGAVGTQ